MSRVRGHTRNVDGRDVRVRSHSRRLQPGRGMNNLGRAYQSARRQKRSAALTFAGLGIAEIGAWFTLKGVGLVLMTVGVIALGIGYAATRPTSTRRTIDPWQVAGPKQRRQPQPVDPEAQSVEAAADLGRRHAAQDTKAGGFGKGYDGDKINYDRWSDREREAYEQAYSGNVPSSWRSE